jgi:hypothetical protein
MQAAMKDSPGRDNVDERLISLKYSAVGCGVRRIYE